GRAREVFVYAYGGRAVGLWWDKAAATLARQPSLAVIEIPPEASQALAGMAARTMRLQFTIQEGHAFVTDGERSAVVDPRVLKAPG
ncbi:MAG TPA: YaeQ family protein, partial [Casimicrobiaceae bacterium]|nr:YaeQ family protein [Casimicrobiaceae bacterium]